MSNATNPTGQHGIGFLKLIQDSSDKTLMSLKIDVNSCQAIILRNGLKLK